jgi:hypothetical protein
MIGEQRYLEVKSLLCEEQAREIRMLRKIPVENSFEAEILYRSLRPVFMKKSRRKHFQSWLSTQELDLPFIQIMEFMDTDGHELMDSFICQLYNTVKSVHQERSLMRKQNRISSLIASNITQSIDSNNSVNNTPVSTSEQSKPLAGQMLNQGAGKEGVCSNERKGANGYRFAVSLSFPGEYRDYVQKIADCLSERFGEKHILYDMYHDAEFARIDLDLYLQELYSSQSELIVVFLCKEYNEKKWCGIEARAIRPLTNNKKTKNRVMFVKIGSGEVDGFHTEVTGYFDAVGKTAEEVAEKIMNRYDIETHECEE